MGTSTTTQRIAKTTKTIKKARRHTHTHTLHLHGLLRQRTQGRMRGMGKTKPLSKGKTKAWLACMCRERGREMGAQKLVQRNVATAVTEEATTHLGRQRRGIRTSTDSVWSRNASGGAHLRAHAYTRTRSFLRARTQNRHETRANRNGHINLHPTRTPEH